MKAQKFKHDIFTIQNESEASMESDIPKAIQESKELASKILSDLKPIRAASLKQTVWKKKKRSAPNKTKGNPLKKRTARFEREVKRRPKPVDKQDLIARRFRRQVCMIGNKHNSADKIQKSVVQKQIFRCARSSYFGDKESSLEAEHTKGSKRKKNDQGEKKMESSTTHNIKKKQMLRLKGKRRSKRTTYRGKQQFVSSIPVDSYDSSYSLSSYFTPSSILSNFRRLKRSLSSFYEKENSSEDPFLINRLQGQKRQGRKTKTLKKRRDIESKEALSVKTVRLALRALQTQKKLSEMVDQLSNPSSHMSREEKLSYMHELLDELKLFIKLLQEQILLQSLNEVRDLTTIAAPLS